MKAKTIKKVIKSKVDDWLASIEDQAVRDLASKNTIVTGGCIASMLLNEDVNDFDLYFTNKETTVAVAKYYVSRFHSKNKAGIEVPIYVEHEDTDRVRIVVKSAGIASEEGAEKPYEYFEGRPDAEAGEYVGEVLGDAGDIEQALEETTEAALAVDDGKPKYRPVFLSTNAITLSHKVQIVLRFYGSADKIHENYDYVHCTNYWTSNNDELTLRQPALESLLAKELRYVGSKYPICSVIRLRKFIKRGWTVNAGQILKMMLQISELDLKDHAVLQDQLTGVDAAYFVQLVSKVKEKAPEKVNSAYLVEIIDRMF
jgi:hypothetical protein